MAVRLFTPDTSHVPALGRICDQAFGELHDRHGVERDFNQPGMAEMVIGMVISRPDFFGVAAEDSGEVVGSNFLQLSDAVAAVGPITIKPGTQSHGVGRLLMQAVMDEAERRGVGRVRLMQEAINTVSLSLYTRLGFVWRDACALMRPAPAKDADPAVRPATAADLPAIDRISARVYHSSRKNEIAAAIAAGMPVFVLDRRGSVVAYHAPGFFGHGFAESAEDMLTLIGQSMRGLPPMFEKILVPLSEYDLHRGLLDRGGRTVKLFNYMTVGEYEPPGGAWIPSIGC